LFAFEDSVQVLVSQLSDVQVFRIRIVLFPHSVSAHHITNLLPPLIATHTMNLGDSFQAADVIIGAISLIVTLLGTCLTWYAAAYTSVL
jgi:hypothetical protein